MRSAAAYAEPRADTHFESRHGMQLKNIAVKNFRQL